MMPISASAISEAVDHAFRAALLLTSSADFAETAVLNGIAGLETSDDVEQAVVAKTIDFVLRQRADHPNRSEHSLALLPHEFHWLLVLAPVSRDCFLLRILFGITPLTCAAILNLTIEEFEESLRSAFERLPMVGTLICSPGPVNQTIGAQQ